jgi:GNAT superfamily N-acetyltransferase
VSGALPDELDWRIGAADRNFVASFEKLVSVQPGAELRRFGTAVTVDSRIPVRILNGIAVLEPVASADVNAALGWIRERDIPFAVWVREEQIATVGPTLLAAGLTSVGPEPVMGIRPPAQVPPPPTGVSVIEVVDAVTLEDHIRVTVANGFPEEGTRMLYGDVFLADPDIRMFTAYVDGRPAGHSIAIRSREVSGVYAVGVPGEMRRRGIGSAVTWAAVDAGREWGCKLAVLLSSPMGFGVYRRMGFEVLTHYELYRDAPGEQGASD